MVDHNQKWLSGGPLRHDDGQTMVNHDQFITDGPFQIQEKSQYETWNLCLLDELNF